MADFIEGLSVTALKDLQTYNSELVATITNVDKVNIAFSKLKTPSASNDAIKQLNEDYLKQSQIIVDLQNKIIALENTRKANIPTLTEVERLTKRLSDAQTAEALEVAKLKVQLSEMTKANKASAMEALNTLSSYQKLSSELNTLRNATKSTAVDMYLMEQAGEKNSQAYKELSASYDVNIKKVNQLDSVLKKIDASAGQHQRTVGNYAVGYNGLSNSIQQILREAPAAAVSLNTFFLGISNNLPMFFDEIQRVNVGLKELKDLAAESNAELATQSALQTASAQASRNAEDALENQVASLLGSVEASAAQAVAIREQVTAHVAEIAATGEASFATIANTEAILINAGATVEQVTAIQAEIVATGSATRVSAEHTLALNAQTAATLEANTAVASSPSLMSRLGASLFSINTLLTVGVLALTLYGGKLIEVIGNWFKGATAADAMKQSLEDLDNIRIASIKSVVKEGIELNQNLKIAKNTTLSLKEREIAAKKVLDQYPFWFENLGKEAVLNGNVEKAVKGVNDALLARAKSNAVVGKITENQSQIIDLEEERLKLTQQLDAAQTSYNGRLKVYEETKDPSVNTALAQSEATLNSIRKDYIANEQKISEITETNNRLLGYANTEAEKAIGLDYKADKTGKAKRQKEEIDYLATVYALRKKNNEILASEAERNMNDPELNFDSRREAMENYYFQRQVAAEMAFEEEERLSDLAFEKQRKTYKLAIAEGTATQETLNQIEYQYQINKQLNRTNFEDQSNQITIEKAKALQGVLREITDQAFKNSLSEKNIEDLRQVGLYLKNISGATTLKQFDDLDNKLSKLADSEENRKNESLRNDLETNRINQERIKNQLSTSNTLAKDNKALNELKEEELSLNRQLTESDNARAKTFSDLYETMANSTKDYLSSITDSFFSENGFSSLTKMFDQVTYQFVNDLGKIETKTSSTFQKMIDQAGTAGDKFAIAFQGITEIVQETFAFLNQNQQAYFDAQYARLEKEKDVAILFAGESTTAREEIERQFEDKKRQIRIAEAKATQEAAIFNAVINTAQAVVAFLAQGNYALSILAAVIGAAQISLISSQPLPEYWKGTDNASRGFAWVDERGPELHTDRNGKIKSTGSSKGANLRFLEKGDKIIPHNKFNEGLNNILLSNGISGYSENKTKTNEGMTANDVVNIINRTQKTQSNTAIRLKKTDIKDFVVGLVNEHENMNNGFLFKPKNV